MIEYRQEAQAGKWDATGKGKSKSWRRRRKPE